MEVVAQAIEDTDSVVAHGDDRDPGCLERSGDLHRGAVRVIDGIVDYFRGGIAQALRFLFRERADSADVLGDELPGAILLQALELESPPYAAQPVVRGASLTLSFENAAGRHGAQQPVTGRRRNSEASHDVAIGDRAELFGQIAHLLSRVFHEVIVV